MSIPVARCGDCLYMQPKPGADGRFRRYGSCRRGSKATGWVDVDGNDWCGEFVHRDGVERTISRYMQVREDGSHEVSKVLGWRFPTEAEE